MFLRFSWRADIRSALALFSAGLAVAIWTASAAAQMIHTEQPQPGKVFVNGCNDLPLHTEASAFSPLAGVSELGERFEVVALAGKYVIPRSMRLAGMSHTPGGPEWKDTAGRRGRSEDIAYAWIEVRHAGGTAFASSGCLISPGLFENQNEEDAIRKLKAARSGSAGKGFNIRPVLGRGGKEIGGAMQQGRIDRAALRRLVRRAGNAAHEDYAAFRREGGLGEHRRGAVPPWIRTHPAADARELREAKR